MTQFALVGCGRIAERHLIQINRIGKLAAVCDVDYSSAFRLAAPANANVYTNLDALLYAEQQVEVVVVCTPNGLHAEHAIKSLQARRHVLCEQPLCIAAAAAWTMRDTAHFFRRQLFVVQQNRFGAPVQTVKNILLQNGLGRILSFSINGFWHRPQEYYTGNWKGTANLDGGILYTQFSHFIDLLLWLLGDVLTIKAMAKDNGLRRNFEFEDTYMALLALQNGALGTVHFSINSLPENKEGSITIIGKKGTVRIGGSYLNTLQWNALNAKDAAEIDTVQPTNPDLDIILENNYHLMYDELQKALKGLPHGLPQVQEAAQTIALIERLYAALHQ